MAKRSVTAPGTQGADAGGSPARPRLNLAIPVRIEAVALLLVALFVSLGPHPLDPTTIGTDASNYYAAGLRLNAGHPLYALSAGDRPVPLNPPLWNVPLVSPPFIGVLWRPLALLGDNSMLLWWTAGLVCLCAVTLFFISRATPMRNVLLTLLFPAIGIAAVSGNVNAFLVALAVGAAYAASSGRSAAAGVLIAVMAAIKLTPALLILWFVFQGDWRAVRAFFGAVLVLGAVQLVGAGLDNNLAFFDVLRDTTSGGATPYSIGGMLRSIGGPAWLIGAGPILAMAVAIAAAWAFRSRRGVSWACLCVAVLFGSPVVNLGNFAILLAALVPIAAAATAGASAGRRDAAAVAAGQPGGVALADP